jgi:hypothetical protein
MRRVFYYVVCFLRKIFTELHSSPSRSYLLAGLKTLCETYPGKVLSRELFLPPGDFMEVDTHMWW